MTTPEPAPFVTGVDFVTVPARDFEESVHFYGGVRFVAEIIDSGVRQQAIFLGPAGNALDLHHRFAPAPG